MLKWGENMFEGDVEVQKEIRHFVENVIKPRASQVDKDEEVPDELMAEIKESGYLGATISKEYGGLGYTNNALYVLHEEAGKGCSSFRSLLTVHGMVSVAIERWGNEVQKNKYLPLLAKGDMIACFALSEPQAGSDISQIQTSAVAYDNYYVINGNKKWITFGQIADLFLVFALCDGKPSALLIDRDTEGFQISPIKGFLGARGSMIAELKFENCKVEKCQIIGMEGIGLSHIAMHSLDYGRFSVACSCVGLSQACLDASLEYTKERKCSGKELRKHQLIQKKITQMAVNTEAARLLCQKAAWLKDKKDPNSIMATWYAKYFSAKTAVMVASEAVQIHGANGCINSNPVERYYRDAKINEIIEGSNEIHEKLISVNSYMGN
ncbi:MAG: acyl-CoA dehydrogenase protein [Clostridiales bacterium]|nr:acyl-CoA dehydrogenase protein [Clostridiales bacterium]